LLELLVAISFGDGFVCVEVTSVVNDVNTSTYKVVGRRQWSDCFLQQCPSHTFAEVEPVERLNGVSTACKLPATFCATINTVNAAKLHFTIRVSASRLDKGLLAIPQKFKNWFPGEKSQIRVIFDDEDNARTLTFQPYDPVVKENRIFGLKNWFSTRDIREGDLISVTLEDLNGRLYRIELDRFVRERKEQKSRLRLQAAATDSEAAQELTELSR